MRSTRLTAGLLVGAALTTGILAGCGSDGRTASSVRGAEGDLAAIARRSLSGTISSVESLDEVYGRTSGPRTVGVDVRLDAAQADDGDLVRLTKGPATPAPPCVRADRCTVAGTSAGTRVVTWDLEAPEEDPGYVSVALHGPDDTRTILLAGPTISADPRRARLPYVGSVDRMARILADPAFDAIRLREAGPPARWTPRALAALVQTRVPVGYSFHETPGGIAFRAYGPVVSLVFLTDDGAGTRCPDDFTCATADDLTYAWRPGSAVLLRQRDGYVVRVDVTQRRLTLRGPADFARDEVLGPLVSLTADPELAPELSTDWSELGGDVDWTGPG